MKDPLNNSQTFHWTYTFKAKSHAFSIFALRIQSILLFQAQEIHKYRKLGNSHQKVINISYAPSLTAFLTVCSLLNQNFMLLQTCIFYLIYLFQYKKVHNVEKHFQALVEHFHQKCSFYQQKRQKVKRASNIKFETASSLKGTNKNQNLIKSGFRATPMVCYLLSPFSVSLVLLLLSTF